MDNLFLPRESDSTETGPQIFTKNDGAEPIDFIFASLDFLFDSSSSSSSSEESSSSSSEDDSDLLNSVLVNNGGVSSTNGIYNFVSKFEGKPYYNNDNNCFIVWFNNLWEIYDFDVDSIYPIYFSEEDVLYPWDVINWLSFDIIYDPPPIVTKIL
jgi:hypothetical protein